ncbi:ATP-dependent endonuclease [Aquimarina macrocephali]|uniref:ATP-dependent endonuclease n=1 Tax=Aquimarina macrocephali TaxID=666563 RepID=UPI003F67F103
MVIDFLHIQNFRKLKNCRIDVSKQETVFVGANNSGKTSAMDALILFLKTKQKFNTRDFTLSNWNTINAIGEKWLKEKDLTKIDLTIKDWEPELPTLDLWLHIENNELQHISHIIPTLDWKGGLLGVRLRLEPSNIEELYKEFSTVCKNAKDIFGKKNPVDSKSTFKLWPKNMWDFLDRKLSKFFTVKTYLLDPDLKDSPQHLSEVDLAIEGETLNKLIKVDIINAQRGFTDANSDTPETGNSKNLSNQLRSYYDKHLNPNVNPTKADVAALKQVHEAKKTFDENLGKSFKPALDELGLLNYPGFGNPNIKLSSEINTVNSLQHDSSVQYSLDDGFSSLSLPEKYNGLGYQNLISMIFKIIRFRDEWMKVGKSLNETDTEIHFEPIHLVLIEEPEAHLHAQVQQVFIKEAYKVLRNHKELKDKNNFSTQLIISTHSNHVAHEIDFTSLRYFKRNITDSKTINTSTVVNLSTTFGTDDDTTRFAIRYLKTTHSNLFFADAVILVEGPAERMLLPYFIKHHTKLNNCYISIIEIGGSHAHRLKEFIKNLGVITLIVTDLDSINPSTNRSKVRPELSKGYETGNSTLKTWIPREKDLDKLLALHNKKKEDSKLPIKVAYQTAVIINDGKTDVTVHPYTFEDALVLENKVIFEALKKTTGLLKKMVSAALEKDVNISAQAMYDHITDKNAKKAEFALELFFFEEPNKLKTPKYIEEGLRWLETKLISQKTGLINPKI